MADTVILPLTETFVKVFDATADAGKSFTIQNTSLVPIVFLAKSTTPAFKEVGFILGADKSGAVVSFERRPGYSEERSL